MNVKDIFKIDGNYKNSINTYGKVDGILAISIYIFIMVMYYVMGIIYEKKGIYLGYQAALLLVIVCIACVLIRKQKIASIGFGKQNMMKSIVMGVIAGSIIFAMNVVPGIISGREFNSISKLLSNLFYYLIIIALVEEIAFRGFIQTRIYGIIKNRKIGILIVALMFMSIHIPFQMGVAQMGFVTFVSNNYITLIFTFMWHIVFNFMYAKYNSIVGPTIFHGIMDWSNYLFVR